MYTQYLRDIVPLPSQNGVAVCNQITLLIRYYISSRLATLQVSDIFNLTVSFRFVNFKFNINGSVHRSMIQ
jgi:hypothetical protein